LILSLPVVVRVLLSSSTQSNLSGVIVAGVTVAVKSRAVLTLGAAGAKSSVSFTGPLGWTLMTMAADVRTALLAHEASHQRHVRDGSAQVVPAG
jgi:hypothetical protein